MYHTVLYTEHDIYVENKNQMAHVRVSVKITYSNEVRLFYEHSC